MNPTPAQLVKLSRFASLTTKQVTPAVVGSILEIMGWKLSEDKIATLASTIVANDEDALVTWIMQPENTQFVKGLVFEGKMKTAGNDHSIVVCPFCRNFIDIS